MTDAPSTHDVLLMLAEHLEADAALPIRGALDVLPPEEAFIRHNQSVEASAAAYRKIKALSPAQLRALAAALSLVAPTESWQEVDAVVQEANELGGKRRCDLSDEESDARSELIDSARAYRDGLMKLAHLPSLRDDYLRDLSIFRTLAPAPAEPEV